MTTTNRIYSFLSIVLINLLPIIYLPKHNWIVYMLLQPIALVFSIVFYKNVYEYNVLKKINKAIIVFYGFSHLVLMILYVMYPPVLNAFSK